MSRIHQRACRLPLSTPEQIQGRLDWALKMRMESFWMCVIGYLLSELAFIIALVVPKGWIALVSSAIAIVTIIPAANLRDYDDVVDCLKRLLRYST